MTQSRTRRSPSGGGKGRTRATKAAEVQAEEQSAEVQAEEPKAAPADDFAPTEAELAEAAALKAQKDTPESRQAVADARTQEVAPRSAPKTGRWFGCATDKDGHAMVTEEPYSTPVLAREGTRGLPSGPTLVVAVEAADRDEALSTYEALEDKDLGEEAEVPKARTAASRANLFDTRTEQVPHEVLLVSPTGIAHASDDCRFTRGKTDLVKVPDAEGEVLGHLITHGQANFTDDGDDAKPVKMTGYCVYCAVRQPAQADA